MKRTEPRSDAGMTLVELLVALVIAGLMLSALVGLFIGQSRVYGEQASQRLGRDAVRSALQALSSDLQRLEATGGVVAAAADSITIRVPFAMGLVCDDSGGTATISLLPADSVTFANAGVSGFAWRGTGGGYTYIPGTTVGNGTASVCSGESIATVSGGSVVEMASAGGGIVPGAPALLYQEIRYAFLSSASGASLVRTVLETGEEETLVEFFEEAGTRFRFFIESVADAQDAPPADLGTLRGIELALEGLGDRPRSGSGSVASVPLTATIFFKNRPN